MAFVAQVFLYVLITACFVAVFVFLTRAIIARLSISKDAFNVARLTARRKMMQSALGAIAFLILGLIFFVIVLLFPFGDVGDDEPVVAEEPVATAVADSDEAEVSNPDGSAIEDNSDVATTEDPSDGATIDAVPEATAMDTVATPTATATASPIPTTVPATPTAEPTATIAPTTEPLQALVNSPVVGLYVREGPGGEILERLEDQTAVTVLGEEQTIDDLIWVLVESPNGFVGWVARDFLLFDAETQN